ncbi:MAG: hypothetical protein QGG17_10095 [Rhodospirillales bacterium]|nr:hypothetical protein [Rhodospirillales bacterium]MDP6805834.1 hypothetical protein [Rhodospirillales bacterium]
MTNITKSAGHETESIARRGILRGRRAFLGLLSVIVWALTLSPPASAQTASACVTALDAIRAAGHPASHLRLMTSTDDADTVERILRERGWSAHLDRSDTVQVFSVGAEVFLLMASVQGCHVVHAFTDASALSEVDGG